MMSYKKTKSTKGNSSIAGAVAGIAAGAMVGAAVGCTVKAMNDNKMPTIKKSAKKALKNVEHYIDSVL